MFLTPQFVSTARPFSFPTSSRVLLLTSCTISWWHNEIDMQLKCLLPITLHAVHILNKQQIQKYGNPKTVTYGQTVSVLFLVKNMYLGQQTHYVFFFLFYGWLYMTRRSHRKLHSGWSRSSQYTAIAPLHREFTTHADKLISQRASDPHITQVLRRQATFWLQCFVFLPCNGSVKQSVPQPSLAVPGVPWLDVVGSEPTPTQQVSPDPHLGSWLTVNIPLWN